MLAVLALQAPFSRLSKCKACDHMKLLPVHVCGKQVEKSYLHRAIPNSKEISEHGPFLCAREGEGHFATELVPVSRSGPVAPNSCFCFPLALPNIRRLKATARLQASTVSCIYIYILYIDDHKLAARTQGTLNSFALKMFKPRWKCKRMMAGWERRKNTPQSWWKAGSFFVIWSHAVADWMVES